MFTQDSITLLLPGENIGCRLANGGNPGSWSKQSIQIFNGGAEFGAQSLALLLLCFCLHLLWLTWITKAAFWLLIKELKSREIFRVPGRWGKSSGHLGTDLFCRLSDQKAGVWCLSPHAHSVFHGGHPIVKKKRLWQSWNILDKRRHKRIVLPSLWSNAPSNIWCRCYEEECR